MNDGTYTEVVQGLSPEDKVIYANGAGVYEGLEVTPAENPAPPVAASGPSGATG